MTDRTSLTAFALGALLAMASQTATHAQSSYPDSATSDSYWANQQAEQRAQEAERRAQDAENALQLERNQQESDRMAADMERTDREAQEQERAQEWAHTAHDDESGCREDPLYGVRCPP
jgi:hypothetical protein